jgi:hypothetical protein
MRRNAFHQQLALFLFMALLLPAVQALASTAMFVSFAEHPVQVLRNTDFYVAGVGTQLQPGDIVDSGKGELQVECGPACSIALGPASQLGIDTTSKGMRLILLNGWVKIQTGALPVKLRSGTVEATLSDATLIFRANAGAVALFVEKGEPLVEETEGSRVIRRTKYKREQYAQGKAGQALNPSTGAPRDFIRSAPPIFLDALLPIAFKGAHPPARFDRPATFPEVAPWLAYEPSLRETLDRRLQGTAQKDKPEPARSTAQNSALKTKLRELEMARIRAALEASTRKPPQGPQAGSSPAAPAPAPAPAADAGSTAGSKPPQEAAPVQPPEQ